MDVAHSVANELLTREIGASIIHPSDRMHRETDRWLPGRLANEHQDAPENAGSSHQEVA